jgi:hypothetical protein
MFVVNYPRDKTARSYQQILFEGHITNAFAWFSTRKNGTAGFATKSQYLAPSAWHNNKKTVFGQARSVTQNASWVGGWKHEHRRTDFRAV